MHNEHTYFFLPYTLLANVDTDCSDFEKVENVGGRACMKTPSVWQRERIAITAEITVLGGITVKTPLPCDADALADFL